MLGNRSSQSGRTGLRLALLTNFVAPYRIPVFQELARRVAALRVMISTRMEEDRFWEPEFGGLDVVVQRNFMMSFDRTHPSGFREKVYTHFPYDTVPQLINFRPHVIISGEFGFRTFSAVIYRVIFRRSRLVIWATISEATEAGRWVVRRAFRHLAVRFADAIITNGQSGTRYMESYNVMSAKLFAVPQTTDAAGFASVPLTREENAAYRLLYVGRLISLKAVVRFTKILAQWCRDNPVREVQFWLAGDGPERGLIEQVDLPQNLTLRFLGNIPYADMPRIYQQAGALVLPTLADEWGLVVNEALAAGLPVLGSVYSQAVQEMIEDGVNGWTYCIDHPEQVSAKLQLFFNTGPEDLAQMREVARTTALRLTPEVVIDRMMHAVRYALGEQEQSANGEEKEAAVEPLREDL